MQCCADEKERYRSLNRNTYQELNDYDEGEAGGYQDDEPHGEDLAGHDFEGGHRHHEEVLDGPALALTDQSGAGQDDREHGDVVDHLNDASEPGGVELGIEASTFDQLDRWLRIAAIALHELLDLGGDDAADVAGAGEGLAHARCVDVELECRSASGEQVSLELDGNVEREGVEARVHACIHLGVGNVDGLQEEGWIEGVDEAPRQLRTILVDNGDGCLVQGFWHRGRRGIDREGEGVDDQNQHDRVAQQAAQFLHAQVQDVCQAAQCLSAPVLSAAARSGRSALARRAAAVRKMPADQRNPGPWRRCRERSSGGAWWGRSRLSPRPLLPVRKPGRATRRIAAPEASSRSRCRTWPRSGCERRRR